jgi:hypothetical protein
VVPVSGPAEVCGDCGAPTDQGKHGTWEYGQLYSGGGYLTFNPSPEVEKIWPLADRLRAGMQHGGRVYRRAIIVLSDWEEITEVAE